jgi:hypothetical protein
VSENQERCPSVRARWYAAGRQSGGRGVPPALRRPRPAPSRAVRAGCPVTPVDQRTASDAVHRRAEERPRFWAYWGVPTTQRGAVAVVVRPPGMTGQPSGGSKVVCRGGHELGEQPRRDLGRRGASSGRGRVRHRMDRAGRGEGDASSASSFAVALRRRVDLAASASDLLGD